MFGIGETELVIIVVFAFMLFGPDKLPSMGRTLGRVLRQFREASDGFTEVVQTNIMDPAAEELEKSPKQRRREAAQRSAEDAAVEAPEAEEGTDVAEAPRRETFAERKARLAAERAAREKADEEAAAAVATDGPDQDASEPSPESQVFGPAAAPAEQEESAASESGAEAPSVPSAADLYATTRHSSRYRERTADSQDAAVPTDGEEDGTVEA